MLFSSKRASLLSLLLVSSVAITPALQAIPRWAKMSGAALVAAAIFRFYSKKGTDLPNRTKAADLLNFDEMESLPANLWYAIDDMVIGHGEKSDSAIIERDEEGKPTGKIDVKPGYKARGLGGMIQTYWKPVTSTALALAIAYKLSTGWRDVKVSEIGKAGGETVGNVWDALIG